MVIAVNPMRIVPTSTAAIPTRLCITATSSGIWVISTLNAARAPIKPPTTSAMIKIP